MAADEAMAPASGGDEVALLRQEVGQLAQEILMHRQVLEQCLEVRESVLELLEHREALTQCLELREGVQAALSSTQVIGEVVYRTAELDLSLAGVSDNTARHGRAISNLNDQQTRTNATLDAVVRAVKRLDRSRSRTRGGLGTPTPVHPGHTTHRNASPEVGLLEDLAATASANANGTGWIGSEPGMQDPATCAPDGYGVEQDPWFWPGEGNRTDRTPRMLGVNSCGSDERRDWRPSSASSVRGSRPARRSAGRSGGADMNNYRAAPDDDGKEPVDGTLGMGEPTASNEMEHCVKDFMVRINQALSKLDGPGVHGQGGEAETDETAPARPPESWADAGPRGAVEARGQTQRPGSAYGSRGSGTARGAGTATPRGVRGDGANSARQRDTYRNGDSWK